MIGDRLLGGDVHPGEDDSLFPGLESRNEMRGRPELVLVLRMQQPLIEASSEENDDRRLVGQRREGDAVRIDDAKRRFRRWGCETESRNVPMSDGTYV